MTSAQTRDDLLEQAIGYALGSVAAVTPRLLTRPTPCGDWDLSMLLLHSCDSLAALGEGVHLGRVQLAAAGENALRADSAGLFTARAGDLMDGWSRFSGRWVCVGEYRLAVTLFAAAGALEVAVHGWDVARACGQQRPIPAQLAEQLLSFAPLLITDADRAPAKGPGKPAAPRFGLPVAVSPVASPSDRLTAYLGRVPTA